MLLEGKNILVFAASGAIGSEASRRFAREGAHVWISGRNVEAITVLADQIKSASCKATAHAVDATDSDAVNAYVDQVAETAGHIDGVFNAIGGRPVDLAYPEHSTTQSLDRFMIPMQTIAGSQFLTSRAAARHMLQQGSGAIVILSRHPQRYDRRQYGWNQRGVRCS